MTTRNEPGRRQQKIKTMKKLEESEGSYRKSERKVTEKERERE